MILFIVNKYDVPQRMLTFNTCGYVYNIFAILCERQRAHGRFNTVGGTNDIEGRILNRDACIYENSLPKKKLPRKNWACQWFVNIA